MSVVIGIDVGGSTTKIVGFKTDSCGKELITPQVIKANDPITSIYGAFGKFTDENNIPLSSIDNIMMTGVGSAFVEKGLYGLKCTKVPEFEALGLGGLYLSKLPSALCISMGTGTALVHAIADGDMKYLGGTGVGGGTLMGLSKLLLGAELIEHISDMATAGKLANVDLFISDMTKDNNLTELARDLTASNFGNVSDIATKEDIGAGLFNLVFETVGMISVFGARSVGVKDIVLTGNLTQLNICKKKFVQFNSLYEHEGLRFIIPEKSQYATAIGAALCACRR